jgi:hypothetical protein
MRKKQYDLGICRCSSVVEQLFCKQSVVGSNPTIGSMARYRSGQTGQTVNLLAYAFGGSTPSLATMPM